MAECGLVNLGSCLIQKTFEYILTLLNAPISPFLQLNLNLLSEPININLFLSLWTIVVYVLSMFYAILIMYSGFNFIISGYDSARRENAKNWLRNVLIMIILVQASFFIYKLTISLSASLTSAMLTLIDPNFYLIGVGGIADLGMAILFSFLYVCTLITTSFVLVLRYAIVSVGVVFFPIAIFFYFIPALKQYGSLIMNFLEIAIFISFLDAIILIGFSKLITIGIFANMTVLILISAFLLIDILTLFLMFFSIVKSAFKTGEKIAGTIGSVAKYFA